MATRSGNAFANYMDLGGSLAFGVIVFSIVSYWANDLVVFHWFGFLFSVCNLKCWVPFCEDFSSALDFDLLFYIHEVSLSFSCNAIVPFQSNLLLSSVLLQQP